MGIVQGKDTKSTNMGSNLLGLYYYLLENSKVNDLNSSVLGYTSVIENICYNPFLEGSDLSLNEIDFDTDFFIGATLTNTPKVYRINSFPTIEKVLGEFDILNNYKSYTTDYESKLLLYPFRYFMLTDYINPPLLIKPQLWNTSTTWQFKVRICLSQSSKYCLYPFNYKLDFYGNLEGIINNNPLLFPVSSNQYSAWLTSQGATFSASNSLALMENDQSTRQAMQNNALQGEQNLVNGIVGMGVGLGSAITNPQNAIGGIMGAVNSGIDTYYGQKQNSLNSTHIMQNSYLKEYQVNTLALARKTDLMNTPRAIKSIGNDGIFSMGNGRKRVDLIEYTITPQRKMRIMEYFNRYGYKVNDYVVPNFKSRKYWNFIKTIDCDIDSAQIPHNDILEIQNIFNSGVTFWHIDNGAEVKNYYMENSEV